MPRALMSVLRGAAAEPGTAPVIARLAAPLAGAEGHHTGVPARAAILVWTRVHGIVSLELTGVFGHPTRSGRSG